jgi:hypothetical protein
VWSVIKPIFDAISSAASTVSGAISSVTSAASSVTGGVTGTLSKIGGWLGFEEGGFVPGTKGAPSFAIVHGGEYVLSNDMLSGRAPIDNRAMAGVLSATSAAGTGGTGSTNASALAVGSATGNGSITVIHVNVKVAGNVTSEKKLVDTIRTQVLQFDLRNSTNGLSLTR